MPCEVNPAWSEALKHEDLLAQQCRKYIKHLDPNLGLAFDDLMSYGWEGMLRAVENFDPSKGFKFSTYAATCVKHALDKGV